MCTVGLLVSIHERNTSVQIARLFVCANVSIHGCLCVWLDLVSPSPQ